MPGHSGGFELGLLQRDPATKDIPVIFLTAKVQAADRRRFTELGVRSMIAKPFDPLRLAARSPHSRRWPTARRPAR